MLVSLVSTVHSKSLSVNRSRYVSNPTLPPVLTVPSSLYAVGGSVKNFSEASGLWPSASRTLLSGSLPVPSLAGGVEAVDVLAAHRLVAEEAVRVFLVELGDVLRDRVDEAGVVVPVAKESAEDLVSVRLVPLALFPADLLGAEAAEVGAPAARQVVRGVRVGRVGQREAHVLLEVAYGVQPDLGRLPAGPVDRHLGVELQRLLRPAESLVELGGELAVLLTPVVADQPVEFGQLLVGHLVALVGEFQRAFDLRVVQGLVRAVPGVVRIAAVALAQGAGHRRVDLRGVGEESVDTALQLLPGVELFLRPFVRVAPDVREEAADLAVADVLDADAEGGGVCLHRGPDLLLQGGEFRVGVVEDLVDAVGLGVEVGYLLGRLAHELPCHRGVHPGPAGGVGLGLHALAGVLGLGLETVDGVLPVGDGGGEPAQVDLDEVRERECHPGAPT